MAAKDSKEISLAGVAKLFTKIPAGKTLIEVDKLTAFGGTFLATLPIFAIIEGVPLIVEG